jgi:hypothetical protein
MRSDKMQSFSSLNTRQKVTTVIFVIILLIVLWQVWGLFGNKVSKSEATLTPVTAATSTGASAMAGGHGTPKSTLLIPTQTPPMTQRELELMKMQQDTEAKYLAALNELELLKVSRQLAETNQAIMNARLSSVTSAKKIVELLTPPPAPVVTPQSYAQGLISPFAPVKAQTTSEESLYTAISVVQLRGKWSAVLGYKGTLFYASRGDVLPPDRSRVVRIDRTGVILERDGLRRKISMVPVI